ncbi:MAG: ornithine carbamoyltransferase [Candidatus Nitrosothermus koennekii]|nr:MAG: ornithine carbamoyltransferase [Candidatus Nitrosothermus koennekii]
MDKDLLSLMELDKDELNAIIESAIKLKKDRYNQLLKNKVFTMIFQKASTRTRVSFEVAMLELGGNAISLNINDIQLSRGESIEDTARTLALYSNGIGARVYAHDDVVRLAKASRVPVINMLSELYHPCQILGDLLTIREVKNKDNLTLAWIGDGNNVCNSLIIGCHLSNIKVRVGCPEGYEPYEEALNFAKDSVEIIHDPRKAIKDADIVYTDSFVSMGHEEEREERLKIFLPDYQVNSELFSLAKEDAIFMHCLPAKRGEEVTDDVIDSDRSVVWQQAENRLHAQKALLVRLLK